MSNDMIIKLLTLGIPFLIALFIPIKSKKQIDNEVEKKLKQKFS